MNAKDWLRFIFVILAFAALVWTNILGWWVMPFQKDLRDHRYQQEMLRYQQHQKEVPQ